MPIDLTELLTALAAGTHDRLGSGTAQQQHHLRELSRCLREAAHHAEALGLLAEPDR